MKNSINASDRGAFYEVLASCFLQLPTKEKMIKVSELLMEAKTIFPQVDLMDLAKEATQITEEESLIDDNIAKIQQEYHNHFFIPTASTFIPPYESALDGIGKKSGFASGNSKKRHSYNSLWGASTHDVQECYNSVGFNPFGLNVFAVIRDKRVPDHLGFELAFMAYLCGAEGVANGKDNNSNNWHRLQKQFLEEHLLEFAKNYSNIATTKSQGFYQELAKTVDNFVSWDTENN